MDIKKSLPYHIGFIMDGNGRWAEERNLPRKNGHEAGAKALQNMVECCYKKGIKIITFYGFSTENWSRPESEVKALMKIITNFLMIMIDKFNTGEDMYRKIKVNFIGDITVFNSVQKKLMKSISERSISDNYNMILNIAVNYGGRADIVNAVNCFIKDNPNTQITEKDICNYIYTKQQPDPDLIIRTAGEMRLSNFLIWQAAYSELYSTPVYWPDFNESTLDEAIQNFNNRTRKFGGIK